ncbi:MAG: hypothetical protein FD147_778 [Chloroflexi bacterium]|nr:MAG: hypothetical protein FD147_778 [Chloroflexota bacterium]MBA4375358.1 DUF554 domain-containing protein [Anaerolinea sp.]
MTGTLINVGAILVGGLVGLLLGSRLADRIKRTVISGLGLFTLVYGVSLFLKTQNALIVLGSLLLGILIGEWWRIEEGLQNLGVWLEARFNHGNQNADKDKFIKGFLAATLVFCIGPMAILGSIEDGLTGNVNTLVVKSILDGFGAMAFASSLGVGVLFSALMVLIYQGSISLLAAQVQSVATPVMMSELTATGGVILMGIALSGLLEIKQIRTASYLPALMLAPLIVFLITLIN